ncbi:RICIN domain-containing protein [Streptomyces polychromogenes]|nr:RICIN domain-containing protein [Streptomyces polychromogenes]
MAVAAGSLVMLTPTASSASSTSFVNWGSMKCLEIENSSTENGAHAQQWDCNGQPGADWEWEYVGPGQQFFIKNVHSGKCLEVENGSKANGATVQQWTCNPQARGMLWIKEYGGSWYIRNYGSGKVLEVENSSTRNGARVQQWDKSDTAPGQRWY